MRIGKETAIHFGSQIARSAAGFVGTLAIARILGAEGLGAYAVVVALTAWVGIPTSAISQATNKRVSEGRHPRAAAGAGLTCQLVTLVAILVLLAIVAEPVAEWFGPRVPQFVAILLVGQAAYHVVIGALRGDKQVGFSGILDAVEQVIRTILQVGFLIGGCAILGLVVGHSLALVLVTIVGVVSLSFRPALPDRDQIREIISFAKYNWFSTLRSRSFAWMDTIVLAALVDISLVGVYEGSWRLASLLGLLSISIQQTLFPELSELSVSGDHGQIKHLINEGLAFTGLLVIPGLFGAAVIGRQVLKIYRPEFTQGSSVLLILIGARIASAYRAPFMNAIFAIDRADVAFRIDLAFVISNALLNVVLVLWLGWIGAAIATLLTTSVTLVYGYTALQSLIGAPSIPIGEISMQVVASAVMGISIWGTAQVLPTSHLSTVGQVFLGVAIYGIVLVSISTRVRTKLTSLIRFTLN